jgi:hypothetical protein
MSTGHTISIGYNGNSSTSLTDEEAFQVMVEHISYLIQENPAVIIGEALAGGASQQADGWPIADFVAVYKKPVVEGGPMQVFRGVDVDSLYVHISCSGGGESVYMKEHIARAICRLAMRHMHEKSINVNITVG